MNRFVVSLAGHVIQIEAPYPQAEEFCRDFMSDGAPEFSVRVEQRDINDQRLQETNARTVALRPDSGFALPALHRLLTERLIDEDILLMHGAVIALNGEAYLFTAPSRTGKTTQIWQWLDHCPDAVVVNGDKPFIRFPDDGAPPLACGSPWAGKESMYANVMVPLKAIVLMERAEDSRMERITLADAFPTLLQQVYRPEDPEKMRKTLRLLRRLDPAVSLWRFRFNNLKSDCFPTAYRALTGHEP